jgi:hypothetical protein
MHDDQAERYAEQEHPGTDTGDVTGGRQQVTPKRGLSLRGQGGHWVPCPVLSRLGLTFHVGNDRRKLRPPDC